MAWTVIQNSNRNVKPHVCSSRLRKSLTTGLKKRFGVIDRVQATDWLILEMGMMSQRRSETLYIDLEGLTIAYDVSSYDSTMQECLDTKERIDLGQPYFKLHGRESCLCLTPSEMAEFINQLMTNRSFILTMKNDEEFFVEG